MAVLCVVYSTFRESTGVFEKADRGGVISEFIHSRRNVVSHVKDDRFG
jgi:hypothetical protein